MLLQYCIDGDRSAKLSFQPVKSNNVGGASREIGMVKLKLDGVGTIPCNESLSQAVKWVKYQQFTIRYNRYIGLNFAPNCKTLTCELV